MNTINTTIIHSQTQKHSNKRRLLIVFLGVKIYGFSQWQKSLRNTDVYIINNNKSLHYSRFSLAYVQGEIG